MEEPLHALECHDMVILFKRIIGRQWVSEELARDVVNIHKADHY